MLLTSCSNSKPRYEQLLGTICVVNLFDDGSDKIYDEIFNRLKEIDSEFAIEKRTSDLYRVNSRAFVEPVTVGDDVFSVLQSSLLFSQITDGDFDVSIQPIVQLWNINSPSPHVATKQELAKKLPLVDYRNIILNPENKSVHFLKENMGLDFGGIAKGYAADEVVEICKKHKVSQCVIDLGGNIYVYGQKKKGVLWNVGIKNPELPDSVPLLKIAVPETSVVTSGIYERYFDDGQKRYHHIFSPKTGCPVENDLYSVSVICSSSMIADALTTTFFVFGAEKSIEMIPKLKSIFNIDIQAVFIFKDHTIKLSSEFSYNYDVLYGNWSVK